MSVHKNLSNNSWYVKYKNTTKRGFKTKKEASNYEAKLKLDLVNDKSKVMFYDVINDYLKSIENNVSYATYSKKLKAYENIIKPNIKNKNIFKVDETECRNFRDFIQSLSYSTTHKNYLLGLYKSVFKHAMIYYNLKNNPTYVIIPIKKSYEEKLKKRNNDNNIWTTDEFYKFVNFVSEKKYQVLFTILYFTGIRLGECLALKWCDFYDDCLDINKSVTKHTKKGSYEIKETKNVFSIRKVTLGNYVSQYLNDFKHNEMKVCGFNDDWFIFGRLKPVPRSTLENIKDTAIKKAHLKRIRIHDFRHAHASNLISSGVNIVAVSKRLGHSDVNITLKVYTHLIKDSEDYLLKYIEKSSQNLLEQ